MRGDFKGREPLFSIGKEGRITSPESRIEGWVIPVDEASVLAREAMGVIEQGGKSGAESRDKDHKEEAIKNGRDTF